MTTQVPDVIQTSAHDLGQLARRYLTGRRGVIVLAVVVPVAGLALNWSWLVAAGIAPILISVLPCVAMCALGLCMNRRGGHSCSTEETSSKTVDTMVETTPPIKILELRPDTPMDAAANSIATNEQADPAEERRMTHA